MVMYSQLKPHAWLQFLDMDARVHQAFESSLENFVERTFKPMIMTNFAQH